MTKFRLSYVFNILINLNNLELFSFRIQKVVFLFLVCNNLSY